MLKCHLANRRVAPFGGLIRKKTTFDSYNTKILTTICINRLILRNLSGHTYSERPGEYLAFVRRFGTHTADAVTLGGGVRVVLSVDRKDLARTPARAQRFPVWGMLKIK